MFLEKPGLENNLALHFGTAKNSMKNLFHNNLCIRRLITAIFLFLYDLFRTKGDIVFVIQSGV